MREKLEYRDKTPTGMYVATHSSFSGHSISRAILGVVLFAAYDLAHEKSSAYLLLFHFRKARCARKK